MIAALVRASVRRPGLVVALALALLGWSLTQLRGARLDVFPEFAPPQVVIQTEAPGLGAGAVEAQVSQPIEQAVSGLVGLRSLRSQSIPGLSVVTLIFEDGSDLPRNRQQAAERLAQASGLPAGVLPHITPLTSSASTVLGVGLSSDTLDGVALRSLVEGVLRPQLLAVEGVADVNVFGGQLPQWQVQVDPAALARLGLGLDQLAEALKAAGGARPAGFVETVNQRVPLSLSIRADSAEALEAAVIAQRGAQPVLLGEVAKVRRAGAPATSGALIDARPGVLLMIQGQLGANTRQVTARLDAALAGIEPALRGQGARLHRDLFRPALFIETAVGHVQRDVLIGSALVIAVLFLFLFNGRTALVSVVAIPLSLMAAVMVLTSLGMSLNIMVLGGLAIALGEVVDDAIIDSENIFRRLREHHAAPDGRPLAQVVFDASMEVRASVVYATFIVALVFVPLLTLSGVAGKLFAPLGLAYIAAILASLAVALTVTPAMSLLLLGSGRGLPAGDPPLIAWMKPRYARLLRAVERHAGPVLAGTGALMVLTLAVLPLLAGQFIPPLKEGHYIVHASAVPGTSLTESLRLGEQVSKALLAIDGVQSAAQWVGRAQDGADTFGPHYSEIHVEVGQKSGAEQARIVADIRRALAGDDGDGDRRDEDAAGSAGFPGLQFGLNTFLTERIGETVAGHPADVVVNLYGPSLDALDRDSQAVAAVLADQRGVHDVQALAPPGAPELAVRLRPEALARHGLSAGEVMAAVQMAYDGLPVGQVFGQDRLGGRPTPLVLTLAPERRDEVGEVAHLPLRAADGHLLSLGEVADVELVQGRYKILREGGRRVQTVVANIDPRRDPERVVERLRADLARRVELAPGHHVEVTGKALAQRAARQELIGAALLAGLGVAALLHLAFGSLRHLALTFVNLPFALVGGVAAVLAGGGWLSLGSVVGFVTLFGITLRNSIMLVSHAQHLVEVEGLPWSLDTALRAAQERLPSILMTALVTGLGLAPLALGSAEPGREIEGPMATIIVGGLISSTLLNLLVLPTVLLRFGRFRPAAPAG